MIKFQDKYVTVEVFEDENFDKAPEGYIDQLRECEEEMKIQFLFPPEITNHKDKTTYRIGFLTELLKKLYPDKKRGEIYEILEKRYLIFLSRRQIERHVKAFLEDGKKE